MIFPILCFTFHEVQCEWYGQRWKRVGHTESERGKDVKQWLNYTNCDRS